MLPKLKTILQEIFNLTDNEFSETLTKDEISSWDSLKHMQLITTLEKEFLIDLTVHEIVSMQSISDILSTLENKGVKVNE